MKIGKIIFTSLVASLLFANSVKAQERSLKASARDKAIFLEANSDYSLELNNLLSDTLKKKKRKKITKVRLKPKTTIDTSILSINSKKNKISNDDSIQDTSSVFTLSTGEGGAAAKVLYLEFFKKGKLIKSLTKSIPIVVSKPIETECQAGELVCAEIFLNSCLDDDACPINFVKQPSLLELFDSQCEAERFGAEVLESTSACIGVSEPTS